ncbi:unnamed protein product [Oreochromis niloticus]|nr:unnamed protein product [Mustela putorius furo]
MTVSYISTAHLEELRQHTAQDDLLRALSTVIQRGWPSRESQVQPALALFFPYRDELSMEDGIIMKSHKTVIPQSLHKEYINIVHKGHPGTEATKRRARSVIFWPAMSKDITEELLSCTVCNSTKTHKQREPLQLHPVPDLPWSTVAADIFTCVTRVGIPVCSKLLAPIAKNTGQICDRLRDKRLRLKRQYDKSSRMLQSLQEGQVVHVQTEKGYDKLGIVERKSKEPRSYIIQVNGRTYRRNRRHILPVAEPPPPPLHDYDPECQDTNHSTMDSSTLTPQSHTRSNEDSQNTSSPQPQPAVQVPGQNIVNQTPYTTRAGRICRPNPRYM